MKGETPTGGEAAVPHTAKESSNASFRYSGYQRFFLARGRRIYFASLCFDTNGEAARKTSGTEQFHSLFSLSFDHFYRITFKVIPPK